MFDLGVINFNISIKDYKKGYYLSIKDNAIYRENFPIDKKVNIRNHSPLGLTWGYNGSGPSQSALAILFDFTKNEKFTLKYYEEFRNEVISNIPQKDCILKFIDIQNWVDLKNTQAL